jgi:hypothetical protein
MFTKVQGQAIFLWTQHFNRRCVVMLENPVLRIAWDITNCRFMSDMPTGLTLSNPIFLPTAYSRALICFGRERGWWITCNYFTVYKEKNMETQKEYNLRYLLAKVRTT